MKRFSERYYINKVDILQQRRDKCAYFKNLDIRLTALEEELSFSKMTR